MSNQREKPMKLMAYASLLVMFVIGVIVGGLGVNAYNKRHQQPIAMGPGGPGGSKRPRGPGGPNGGGDPNKIVDRLRTELQLTDDQTKQVRDIMTKTRDQFQQLRNESRPKYLAIREQSEQQMKAVLTPEQQAKLQQLLQDDHDRGDHGDHGDHDRDGQKQQH